MFRFLIERLERGFEQRVRRSHAHVGQKSAEVDFSAGKELVATLTNYRFGSGLFLRQHGRFTLELTGLNRSQEACFATLTRAFPSRHERSWLFWQDHELHMTTSGPSGEWLLNGSKVAEEERPNRLSSTPEFVELRIAPLAPMKFHIVRGSPVLLLFERHKVSLPLPSLRSLGMPLLKTSSLPSPLQSSRLACLLTLATVLRTVMWFRQTGQRD